MGLNLKLSGYAFVGFVFTAGFLMGFFQGISQNDCYKDSYSLYGENMEKNTQITHNLYEENMQENPQENIQKNMQENTQITRSFKYVVNGTKKEIQLALSNSLKRHLAEKHGLSFCIILCPSEREKELGFIDEKEQSKELRELVYQIKSKTSDPDEQARIAMSLVQNIPYDTESIQSKRHKK